MRLAARMLVEMPKAQHAQNDAIFLEILRRVGRKVRLNGRGSGNYPLDVKSRDSCK